jgi:hypothetical protein
MSRFGSDDFGMIPSWAIAEAMRRTAERRRAEAAAEREREERRHAAALRRRQRRDRVAAFFGALRPGADGPAEA